MLSLDSSKSIRKFNQKEEKINHHSFYRLSIPFSILSKKKPEKFIYNGNEKMYFETRKNTFKKILREEAIKFLNIFD
ncbi:MAG: hypothetical protein KGD63_09400 [Candidatus Lokiarchaeota archaeon]|nr:hypothetical protein [Candidatus Lokiarchaeota archaeon]